jgi:putative hemolysin
VSDSYWLTLIILVCLAVLVNATRASMENVHQQKLIALREERQKLVERTFKLLEAPHFSLALRLGEIVLDFMLAGMVWLAMINVFGTLTSWGFILAGMLLAALVIFGINSVMAGMVLRSPEKWALRLNGMGSLLYGLATPFIGLVTKIKPFSAEDESPLGAVTDDELKTWVEGGQTKGSLEVVERKMIYSIFHLSDTLCREIMVPRIDVMALESQTDLPDAIREITSRGHSRVPVYEENIDNIIGILYAKDLLKVKLENDEPGNIHSLLRPTYFVPEAKKVDELLREMQEKRVHLAVVVDEYGGMAGLVTLEDIVEEIVGEIRDEYDASEEKPYELVGDDEYIFSGRVDVDDVNDLLGTHLTREVADTLGGFIYGEIGRVPVEGEQVNVEDWVLSIEQVLGRRIRRVRAKRLPQQRTGEENQSDESGS